MLRRARQRFFAVGRLQRLIAVLGQPSDQDIPVGFIVVNDEDARWTVHRKRLLGQKFPDLGEKLSRAVGLGDVSVATGRIGFAVVAAQSIGGYNDNRNAF